jgi:hypothetical protein
VLRCPIIILIADLGFFYAAGFASGWTLARRGICCRPRIAVPPPRSARKPLAARHVASSVHDALPRLPGGRPLASPVPAGPLEERFRQKRLAFRSKGSIGVTGDAAPRARDPTAPSALTDLGLVLVRGPDRQDPRMRGRLDHER